MANTSNEQLTSIISVINNIQIDGIDNGFCVLQDTSKQTKMDEDRKNKRELALAVHRISTQFNELLFGLASAKRTSEHNELASAKRACENKELLITRRLALIAEQLACFYNDACLHNPNYLAFRSTSIAPQANQKIAAKNVYSFLFHLLAFVVNVWDCWALPQAIDKADLPVHVESVDIKRLFSFSGASALQASIVKVFKLPTETLKKESGMSEDDWKAKSKQRSHTFHATQFRVFLKRLVVEVDHQNLKQQPQVDNQKQQPLECVVPFLLCLKKKVFRLVKDRDDDALAKHITTSHNRKSAGLQSCM